MRQDSFSSQFVCLCKGKIFILETQLFYHAPNFERNFLILLCKCCANMVKENCSQLIIS